jgi:nicotinamide mononucleotide transporter
MDESKAQTTLACETLQPPPRARAHHLTLAALTLGTSVLAAVMLQQHLTTWLEAISFVTGAVCVWLTVVESTWNFPIGLANVATFLVVFFRARLYSDASLQIIYFVLTAIGWYLWLYGGENQTRLRINRTPRARQIGVGCWMLALWISQIFILRYVGDSAPVIDGLCTALSLGAQWLLDRKNIGNWILWIIADVIYVPLYMYRHLYLTTVLYAVFICMAVIGLLAWQKTFQRHQALLRGTVA